MTQAIVVPGGGYAYLPSGTLPFSNGVVALDGHKLIRVRLRQPMPLAEGFAFAASYITAQNRPAIALAACELRSPAPMTRPEFATFNTHYASLLRANGLGLADAYPIGRSNMAPLFVPPTTNTLFAFTYSEPAETASGGSRDYVISGKPESTAEPPGSIAPGDTSPAGMLAKARYVISDLRARVAALGGDWAGITGAQAYTIHSLDSVIDELRANDLANVGLTLFPAYAPIVGLDFEIDVRSVSVERMG